MPLPNSINIADLRQKTVYWMTTELIVRRRKSGMVGLDFVPAAVIQAEVIGWVFLGHHQLSI